MAFKNTWNNLWNNIQVKSSHELLFEQSFKKGRRKLYHSTRNPEIRESNYFYKNVVLPDYLYKDCNLQKIEVGPPCIFLTPSIDFAYEYFKGQNIEQGYIFTAYLSTTVNLFNPSSQKDIDNLKEYDFNLYRLYIKILRAQESNNKRSWMAIENGNIISAIKEMGYNGFNNYGYLPGCLDFPKSENIALFNKNLLKVVDKQDFKRDQPPIYESNITKEITSFLRGKITESNYYHLLKMAKNRLLHKWKSSDIEASLVDIIPLIELYFANDKNTHYAVKEVLPHDPQKGYEILMDIFELS